MTEPQRLYSIITASGLSATLAPCQDADGNRSMVVKVFISGHMFQIEEADAAKWVARIDDDYLAANEIVTLLMKEQCPWEV